MIKLENATKLLREHVGKRIKCKLDNGAVITDGILTEDDHDGQRKFFICQNVCSGTMCRGRRGYDYSWVIETDNAPRIIDIVIDCEISVVNDYSIY